VGLFKRSDGARVVVTPEVVSPRHTVQVTITTDRPVDKVSSATLEWGYTNFHRYRWAGRADSAASRAAIRRGGTVVGDGVPGTRWSAAMATALVLYQPPATDAGLSVQYGPEGYPSPPSSVWSRSVSAVS
jgi:hypothetical protein